MNNFHWFKYSTIILWKYFQWENLFHGWSFSFLKSSTHIPVICFFSKIRKSVSVYCGFVCNKKEKDVLLHTLTVGWPHITYLDFNSKQIEHSTTKTWYRSRVGHMFSVLKLTTSSNSYQKKSKISAIFYTRIMFLNK